MLWNKRSDVEKALQQANGGAMMLDRKAVAKFVGRCPTGRRVSRILKRAKEIGTMDFGRLYPVGDVAEAIWEEGIKEKRPLTA